MFNDFMLQLHTHLFKDGWRNTLQSKILSTTQGRKPFDDWQNSLGAQNSLLASSTSHILEQQIHNHLNTNINPDTKLECNKNKVHNETVFVTWIEKVNTINTKWPCTVENQMCLVEDAMKHSKAILTGPSAHRNKQTSTSFKPGNLDILAKLLDSERALLNAHKGCTKCRNFYMNHHVKTCPNDFPPATSYKTLTDSMALTTKKAKSGKKSTIAAIIKEPQDTKNDSNIVAVVSILSSVIGNGTNPSSDEYMIPQKHLFLDVFIYMSFMSETCCNALIDYASTTVLIKPKFANNMKL